MFSHVRYYGASPNKLQSEFLVWSEAEERHYNNTNMTTHIVSFFCNRRFVDKNFPAQDEFFYLPEIKTDH